MERLGRPFGWTLMTTLLLVGTVACSFGSGRSQQGFDAINEAVSDVQPALIGRVAYDGSIGSTTPLSQGPTRYLMIFTGGDKEAASRAVEKRMSAAGFSQQGPAFWRRVTGSTTILAFLQLYDPGEKAPRGLIVPSEHTGAWLNFNTGTLLLALDWPE